MRMGAPIVADLLGVAADSLWPDLRDLASLMSADITANVDRYCSILALNPMVYDEPMALTCVCRLSCSTLVTGGVAQESPK